MDHHSVGVGGRPWHRHRHAGLTTPPTLLDQLIPVYDAASRHTIRIAERPAAVYAIARAADFGRLPLIRVLMALRSVPGWLTGARQRPRSSADPDCRVGAAEFTLVAEAPGEELVLALMGRFWTPTGGLERATAEQLRAPPPPGLAQGFWNFRVTPAPGGAELSTETRVRCGDAATRRRFLRYWKVIRPGSGLIRRSALRHIRRQAEAARG